MAIISTTLEQFRLKKHFLGTQDTCTKHVNPPTAVLGRGGGVGCIMPGHAGS